MFRDIKKQNKDFTGAFRSAKNRRLSSFQDIYKKKNM